MEEATDSNKDNNNNNSNNNDSNDNNDNSNEEEFMDEKNWKKGKFTAKKWNFRRPDCGVISSIARNAATMTPLDYFIFFDNKLVNKIAKETNIYYNQVEERRKITEKR